MRIIRLVMLFTGIVHLKQIFQEFDIKRIISKARMRQSNEDSLHAIRHAIRLWLDIGTGACLYLSL